MRAVLAALSLCLVACFAGSAEAHGHHHHLLVHKIQDRLPQEQNFGFAWWPQTEVAAHPARHRTVARISGSRPSDCYGIPWCGCYMRHVMGVADRAYNLARNWAHWGRAGPPGVGAVVVWPHHVGKIVGRAGNGEWLILSGNDGHAVRTRARSIAGAIAIRWG